MKCKCEVSWFMREDADARRPRRGERRSGVFGVENRTIGCEASVNVYEVSVSRVSKKPHCL